MQATMTRQRHLGLPLKRLSKAAKERAIEKTIEHLNESFDPDPLTEFLQEHLSERGFPDMDVYWSLGNCQGDGVAFKGSIDMDELAKHEPYIVEQLAKGMLLGVGPDDWDWSGKIEQNDHHYTHAYTMSVELEWHPCDWGDLDPLAERLDAIGYAIRDHILERIRALSSEMERLGYDEIEYQTSEEMAIKTIEENDYRFDRDGDMI